MDLVETRVHGAAHDLNLAAAQEGRNVFGVGLAGRQDPSATHADEGKERKEWCFNDGSLSIPSDAHPLTRYPKSIDRLEKIMLQSFRS